MLRNVIPVELKLTVLCDAMRTANHNEFDFIWQQFVNENEKSLKDLYIFALGCNSNVELLEVSLFYILL